MYIVLQAATGKAHITIQGGVGNAANSAAMTANLVAMLSKRKKEDT
jgi:hypothetical protein